MVSPKKDGDEVENGQGGVEVIGEAQRGEDDR